MNPSELFQAGQLAEALNAAQQLVKSRPTDTTNRVLFGQLLLFAGDFERADKQFEVVSMQAPDLAVGIALLRQLIRGEVARQQFFSEGRAPSLLSSEDALIRLHLAAALALREGKGSEAEELLGQAEKNRVPVPGCCNDQPFDDVRDLDDLLGPVLEVVTANGKYYWINLSTICSLEFHKPDCLHDHVWRRVTASIANGPDGDVYLPVLYVGSHGQDNELLKLGRETRWSETAPVRGLGQRMFLVGEAALPIMEIQRLAVDRTS